MLYFKFCCIISIKRKDELILEISRGKKKMKIRPKCIKCELDGSYEQIKLSTDNEKKIEELEDRLDPPK
ncbi:hypothetical protein AKJ57_04070 [candidate division MSBL1 archaeon SCGC-AAA259A05]|uniref:Uncharacterized protein n=1 Tax=candidate division MSBL1 archaeon SCGC-AAA259A05 TaxID=1698259 RepID=A0A133U8P1_9EURY|nr:hypothetical protein AKJ57_04070 [candidate division MSBL1 archaeon SCGC-AAA259A05]